ncbi:hypothetical protein [uncultured Mailhella sp.]|uniref:hypothetical protein n=1 Tax=uncultured Mailhella sp. TaxID=1981031 RepID=UPI002613150C|nr:hypothetical protein [uncultured Mailhella sp.]
MKTFWLLLLLLALPLSCSRNAALPADPGFSFLTFAGTALHPDAALPIQGALKWENGTLKIVLMAQQGILLGCGVLDAGTGKVRVLFSRRPFAGSLLKKTGAELAAVLPCLKAIRSGQDASRIDFPANWEYQKKLGVFFHHDAEKELSLALENIQ